MEEADIPSTSVDSSKLRASRPRSSLSTGPRELQELVEGTGMAWFEVFKVPKWELPHLRGTYPTVPST